MKIIMYLLKAVSHNLPTTAAICYYWAWLQTTSAAKSSQNSFLHQSADYFNLGITPSQQWKTLYITINKTVDDFHHVGYMSRGLMLKEKHLNMNILYYDHRSLAKANKQVWGSAQQQERILHLRHAVRPAINLTSLHLIQKGRELHLKKMP